MLQPSVCSQRVDWRSRYSARYHTAGETWDRVQYTRVNLLTDPAFIQQANQSPIIAASAHKVPIIRDRTECSASHRRDCAFERLFAMRQQSSAYSAFLLKTSNIDVVKYCQHYFSFDMPSDMWEKHARTFKYRLNLVNFVNICRSQVSVCLSICLSAYGCCLFSLLFYYYHYHAFGEIKIRITFWKSLGWRNLFVSLFIQFLDKCEWKSRTM